jgi:hypothetical protein
MDKQEYINQLINAALNSTDGAARATPRPYLFTRLNARMQNAAENSWDRLLKFISKPAVAVTAICLVVAINAMVISDNYTAATTATEEQYTATDDYNSTAIVLNDFENTEP